MSKEREGFEAWHDALFDISAATAVKNDYGYPQDGYVQMRWQAWQACAAHYQPLLEAKDAEIAEWYQENTTLKALLEQAREGLHDCNRELWYCAQQAGYDWKKANTEGVVYKTHAKAVQALAAINAATGEK